MELGFIEHNANVIFLGPNGVGKSMLAQNLAYQAVMRGHSAVFVTAAKMLGDLSSQKVPCYVNPEGSNFYARPREGLYAVVDLSTGNALRVIDEGNIAIPDDPLGYTQDEIEARTALRRS